MSKPRRHLSPWTPFVRVAADAQSLRQALTLIGEGASDLFEAQILRNSRYQVVVRRQTSKSGLLAPLVHLSIRRLDRAPVRSWTDLQRIKNEVLSPEHEAVELYPAESRLVDVAHQYHLWAIDDPAFRWPVGFRDRLVGEIEGHDR